MNKTGIQCKTLLQLRLMLREPAGAIFDQNQIWPILGIHTVAALFVVTNNVQLPLVHIQVRPLV